jgi:hypothetical protein
VSLALAAPAAALDPPPTVVTFEDGRFDPNVFSLVAGCPETPVGSVVRSGGWNGGAFLHIRCGFPQLRIRLPAPPQHIVEFFVRAPAGADTLSVVGCDEGFCDEGPDIDRQSIPLAANTWTPVVVVDPAGARITNVLVDMTPQQPMDVDDVAFSPLNQPDTAIAGPSTVFGANPAVFTFSSNVGPSYRCALDAPSNLAPCPSSAIVTGPAPGPHTLYAAAVDVYGAIDPTPAQMPFTAVADADADGILDASDNCPTTANTDQTDTDGDGIGNACDLLPPGNVPPVAGQNAVAKVLSGEVFVKLPTRTTLGFSGMRAPFQESGFVPLKGVASLPVGSTVDARDGELSLASAANGYAPSSRSFRAGEARIKAGIFALRQARLKKKAKKKTAIPTTIALASPAGAEAQCQKKGRPAKGIVRRLTMVAKGIYRTVGGASTATAKSATFNTTDRCNGTLTQVGKGRVTLDVKGRKADVTLRAGRAYFAAARLFAAKKGRKG